MVWKVSTENIQTPIIRKSALDSLEYDYIDMLVAALDNYGGDIDVTKRLREDGNEEDRSGKIDALFCESVFNNCGIVTEDGLQVEKLYVDFDEG